jgi:hypothetical protein
MGIGSLSTGFAFIIGVSFFGLLFLGFFTFVLTTSFGVCCGFLFSIEYTDTLSSASESSLYRRCNTIELCLPWFVLLTALGGFWFLYIPGLSAKASLSFFLAWGVFLLDEPLAPIIYALYRLLHF